ncbi:response regulator [Ferruginibacter paludis]|uniref:ATP-binding protein n=1 Tax=Ferruginibacter paludis TaxID=1310417 RepID=UPI0025B60A16|nr:ATP-binding protein [Ferruginibacter paludis]MDN3656922.1 response regulator [Ferruginibacter paludis]
MIQADKKSSGFFNRLFGDSKKEGSVDLAFHDAFLQLYIDAYVVINTETNDIVDFNEHMVTLFALPPEVNLKKLQINQIMMRYLAEDSDNKDLMMNGIPDYWEGEAGFINYCKEKFYTAVRSTVFFKEEVKWQIITFRDLTAKKNARQELASYKQNAEKAARAKARFLSSMSHELRTPLNGIIGTSNLVLLEANLPENIKRHINILKYSSEHMLGIINDILDFSKIDAGKLELKKQVFNLEHCLNNVIEAFEVQFNDKNLEFRFSAPPELSTVTVASDELKLSQILNNLLSNALKFTTAGNVTFKVAIEAINGLNTTVSFRVTDTGIGIPVEKQAEIFQGFAQVHTEDHGRKFGGTGLGLTISEKLVAKFGGELKVESEPGEGASFYFSVCFENAQLKEPKAPVPHEAGFEHITDTKGLRILVVEDNAINATILISFLRRWGVLVKEAENGIHALELLKFHKFDLILMDLEMPQMDGYQTVKKIRETDQKTPVLAFTASLLEDMESLINEAGFDDYVLKPYKPAELKKKILAFSPHRKIDYA